MTPARLPVFFFCFFDPAYVTGESDLTSQQWRWEGYYYWGETSNSEPLAGTAEEGC
jgi:hypothetical protein